MRIFAFCALAFASLGAALFWITAPSPGEGQLLLRPNTDFTKGRFFAYVGPWGGQTLAMTRAWSGIADGIAIDNKRFPANTTIMWRWPPVEPSFGPGVWGYNMVAYDNYAGGITEQPVAPVQVRDLKNLRQSFRWSMSNNFGDANVLTEFFLRGDTTDVENIRIEVGWFLHAPRSTLRFFEKGRLIGHYVDPSRRRWTVRMFDKFCMFALDNRSDLQSGELDMLHALGWLKQRGLITGDEWLWGFAIGAEPVKGIGKMTLHDWRVVRN